MELADGAVLLSPLILMVRTRKSGQISHALTSITEYSLNCLVAWPASPTELVFLFHDFILMLAFSIRPQSNPNLRSTHVVSHIAKLNH